jgi:hypothetical protein
MSLRIPSIFVLTWLVAVFLCGIQRAAGESPVAFEYKGLPGQMTIEQAKDYGGHSLACETDTIAPALGHCHDHSTTYMGKPAILKLEFIDGNLAMLTCCCRRITSAKSAATSSSATASRAGTGPKPTDRNPTSTWSGRSPMAS